jgi:uncharacterized protein (DUF697 family)
MKAVIAPVVAFVILVIQRVFGIELPAEFGGQVTDIIVTIVTAATTLYGIVKYIIKLIKDRKQV